MVREQKIGITSVKKTKLEESCKTENQLLLSLKQHYLADAFILFKQFRIGAIIFALGLGLILYANASIPSSIYQELLVLLGLFFGGVGFMIAMFAQMRLLIGRLIRFFMS